MDSTKKRDIYHCEICGNVTEVLYEGAVSLVCCGQPMTKLEAKTADQGQEKHVPVVTKDGEGIIVKVGEVEHPMTDEHYIAFIEVLTANKVGRAELAPGSKPEASFNIAIDEVLSVREYCTIHSLWEKKL